MFLLFTKDGFEESLKNEMNISRWSCLVYLPRRLYDEVCQEEPAEGLEDQEDTNKKKMRGGQMGQEDQEEPRRLARSSSPKMKRHRIIRMAPTQPFNNSRRDHMTGRSFKSLTTRLE